MAKTRRTKEERQAEREQKRQINAEDKAQQAADLEKVKAADESAAASASKKKAEKKAEKKAKRRGEAISGVVSPPENKSDVNKGDYTYVRKDYGKDQTSMHFKDFEMQDAVMGGKFKGDPKGIDKSLSHLKPAMKEDFRAEYERLGDIVKSDPNAADLLNDETKNTIADYTRANPTVVNPTISGNDPKTETIKQVSQNQKTFNPKEVEETANNVGEAVSNVSKEVDNANAALTLGEVAAVENPPASGDTESRAVAEGLKMTNVGDIAADGYGGYEMSEEEMQRAALKFRSDLAAKKASAPAAAIDYLGIEHYYPPQQDFITANFTGSYIGSRQLVAGTGALLPVGLLDARKRAQEAKAKEKAANDEKFWNLGDTAAQYDERYKDVGMDILNKYYELSGGNIDELMNGNSELGMAFKRDMYDFQSRGKHLVEVNTNIKAIMDKLNTGEGEDMYIPPSLYDAMKKFIDGQTDMTSFIEGEAMGDEEIRAISNMVRSYQNFTPLADQAIANLKGNADKLPLKKEVDWTDPVVAANYEEAVSKAGSTRDWTAYTKIMGEFVDIDRVKDLVTGIHENNRLWEGLDPKERESIIQDHVRYVNSQLGKKIDIGQEFKATNALGWASLAHQKSVWNTKKQWREQDIETMYEGINREMNDPQFQADIIAAFNASKDPKERGELIAKVYQKYGRTPDATGGYASAVLPTLGGVVQKTDLSTSHVIGKDGNQRSINAELSIRRKELNAKKAADPNFESSKEYKEIMDDINDLKYAINRGNVPTKMNVGKRTVTMSVYDVTNKKIVPIDSYQGDLDPAMLTNTVHLSGVIGIPTGQFNPKTGEEISRESKYTFVNNHNIENDGTRRALSAQEGRPESIGWSKEYWETTGTGESSGSGGSQSIPIQQEGDAQTQIPVFE